MTSAVAGVPEEDVLRIEDPARHDARRRVAFAFARKLTRAPAEVTRDDVDGLRAHFSDPEIVNLVLAVCRYNTMNMLADAFSVPLERENVFAPPPRRSRRARSQ
ncbi:MAG: carboxymuconolactone decarboxylase family protein [Planctomycetota bacterium]